MAIIKTYFWIASYWIVQSFTFCDSIYLYQLMCIEDKRCVGAGLLAGVLILLRYFLFIKLQVRRGPKAIHHPLKPRCSACLAAPVEAGGWARGPARRWSWLVGEGGVLLSGEVSPALAFVS